MKKVLIVIIILIAAYTAYLCFTFEPADTVAPEETTDIDPVGAYIYEGEGLGGDFLISINADGTYSYTEGPDSSYAGFGEWRIEGELIYLTDIAFSGMPHNNVFKICEDCLVYVSEGSDGYTYIELADGARFNKK